MKVKYSKNHNQRSICKQFNSHMLNTAVFVRAEENPKSRTIKKREGRKGATDSRLRRWEATTHQFLSSEMEFPIKSETLHRSSCRTEEGEQ